jgi:hypothetical protein
VQLDQALAQREAEPRALGGMATVIGLRELLKMAA